MKTHAGINQATYVTRCRRYVCRKTWRASGAAARVQALCEPKPWRVRYSRTGQACSSWVLLTWGSVARSNSRFRTNTPDRALHKSLSLSWWAELEGRRRFVALMWLLTGKAVQGLVLQAGTGLRGGHDVCNYVISTWPFPANLWELQAGRWQDNLRQTNYEGCKKTLIPWASWHDVLWYRIDSHNTISWLLQRFVAVAHFMLWFNSKLYLHWSDCIKREFLSLRLNAFGGVSQNYI